MSEWVRKREGLPCTVLAMSIQKGGSGKTTSTVLMSWILARQGYKVLVVDFDSQGNATEFLTKENPQAFRGYTSYEGVLAGDLSSSVYEISENLYLVPADDSLVRLVSKLHSAEWAGRNRSLSLRNALEPIREEFDFILIDLPPNLGELTVNGIAAADYVIPILQTEKFCLSALDRFVETVQEIQRLVAPRLKILGIIATMMSAQTILDKAILETAQSMYGDVIFKSIVKRVNRIKEFTIEGIKDTAAADRRALSAYAEIVEEVIERVDEGIGATPDQVRVGAQGEISKLPRKYAHK